MAAPRFVSVYSGYAPQAYPNDLNKMIKKFGIFEFSEDLNTTPWHVPSPLNLAPATAPLPKFKDYLPNFTGNGTCTVEEHLNAFSNACNNIGANTNDVCMRLFVNTLEGKAAANFFDLPPRSFSNWAELFYWFKSQQQSPADWLREYNSMVFNPGETIKAFNFRFTKLYNKIPEVIRPHGQAALIQYYNTIVPVYKNRLEEKAFYSIATALQTCLEYEDKILRTGGYHY